MERERERGAPESGVDLLLWDAPAGAAPAWEGGRVVVLPPAPADAARAAAAWAGEGPGGWGLFWRAGRPLPGPGVLRALAASGADLAHAGLAEGMPGLLPDLSLVKQDWTMVAPPPERRASTWRAGPAALLVRRDLFRACGGFDAAFATREAAALDLGLRALLAGALVEHRPELAAALPPGEGPPPEPPAADLYAFVLRHYDSGWARYLLARRVLRGRAPWRERAALAAARAACARAGAPSRAPVWYEPAPPEVRRAEVSVVIPTLGRYPYLPAALESLRAQTVRPREVVVVDQNPAEERRPEVYAGWDDLGLRVVWQDERGQSLARNTALAAVSHPYVFFFDDDSVAAPDLVERHLRVVLAGRFDVSTGVSYPPPPTDYRLPEGFAHPRVAQTLDTGNCLMPTALARAMGGLDRNYDFGPGTDADLGTRLYLAGRRIAHTPDAVRVHFKAPMGGLRVHGAHKTNTDAALLAPFPPVTQSYFALRYLSPRQQRERMLLAFVTSKLARPARRGRPAARAAALLRMALWGLLLPLKWRRSRSRARALLRAGVRLAEFPPAPGEAS